MSTQVKTTGGTTLTGFSRNGFGCCARHTVCEMGKKNCFYAEIDKEVPMLCGAFKRHHLTSTLSIPNVIPIIEVTVPKTVATVSTFEEEDDSQLSLF